MAVRRSVSWCHVASFRVVVVVRYKFPKSHQVEKPSIVGNEDSDSL